MSATRMPTSAIGTARITASGWNQLSYWAASTRKTRMIERAKMM